MREATIVPVHEVADAPAVALNKFILKAMREQLFEQHDSHKVAEGYAALWDS